jgi:hypothetical protein
VIAVTVAEYPGFGLLVFQVEESTGHKGTFPALAVDHGFGGSSTLCRQTGNGFDKVSTLGEGYKHGR